MNSIDILKNVYKKIVLICERLVHSTEYENESIRTQLHFTINRMKTNLLRS